MEVCLGHGTLCVMPTMYVSARTTQELCDIVPALTMPDLLLCVYVSLSFCTGRICASGPASGTSTTMQLGSQGGHGRILLTCCAQAYSIEAAAVGSIQAASRRHLAKKRVEEEINWRMFNVLDEHEEHVRCCGVGMLHSAGQAQPNRFVHQLHIERRSKLLSGGLKLPMPGRESVQDGRSKHVCCSSLACNPWLLSFNAAGVRRLASVVVPDDYVGAHVRFPLTLSNVMELLEHFKLGHTLHYKYTMQILLECRKLVGTLPTLNKLNVAEGTQLTVCGDLHGQLQDLFSIFTINDLPSEHNHYLFNGDLVDRGDFGCEVVLTILVFKLLYPNSVHINRGNHEDRAQNETAVRGMASCC